VKYLPEKRQSIVFGKNIGQGYNRERQEKQNVITIPRKSKYGIVYPRAGDAFQFMNHKLRCRKNEILWKEGKRS